MGNGRGGRIGGVGTGSFLRVCSNSVLLSDACTDARLIGFQDKASTFWLLS